MFAGDHIHTYIHTCIHTLHYIEIHYVAFQYITLYYLAVHCNYIACPFTCAFPFACPFSFTSQDMAWHDITFHTYTYVALRRMSDTSSPMHFDVSLLESLIFPLPPPPLCHLSWTFGCSKNESAGASHRV